MPNAQVRVYLTIHLPATLHLYFILSLPHRSKQTMTGWMDDRTNGWMDDGIDGWNDVSWRPLLCQLCRVCIPLFFRPVRINRPWRDGWMTGRMDDNTYGWNDVSRCLLLYVTKCTNRRGSSFVWELETMEPSPWI